MLSTNLQKILIAMPFNKNQKNNSGRLTTIAELTFHTRNAQFMLFGRLNESQSLLRFDRLVKKIRDAASRDDPYADWILIHIYNALIKTQRAFNEIETQYRARLQSEEGIKFDPAKTLQPMTYQVDLNTRYGCMAARLITTYDRIVQCVLAGDVLEGALDYSRKEIFEEILEQLKDVLNKPKLWRTTKVTREDVLNSTPIAEKAIRTFSHLGKLPDEILTKTRRVKDAPRISQKLSQSFPLNKSANL
jgi:integrating conjugative element protein (TIGR03761 family)